MPKNKDDEYLRPLYKGEGNVPEPPFAPNDPWGHKAHYAALQDPARPTPKLDDYDLEIKQWFADNPVKPHVDEGVLVEDPVERGFFRVKGQPSPNNQTAHTTCPVCGAPPEQMPGCYVPYAGRRWDCFEMLGRNLTVDERKDYIEHLKKQPRHPGFAIEFNSAPTSSESSPSVEGQLSIDE